MFNRQRSARDRLAFESAGAKMAKPNLSLNPDAPPAGARSNIFARPPKNGGAPVSFVR
jgi:hypothetical protein